MNSIINCPHCDQMIEIVEENCKIFRCGVFKHNFQQIEPHLIKIKCEQLVQRGEIYGCGRPFQIYYSLDLSGNSRLVCRTCDYI